MSSLQLALEGAGRVLFAGLVFGAGLPVVYALAMRALTLGSVETPEGTVRYSVVGKALAGLLVLVVVAGVVLGLLLIVAKGYGKDVTFDHIVPTVVDSK